MFHLCLVAHSYQTYCSTNTTVCNLSLIRFLVELQVAYFVNSGSEANDLALFMARLHTGNYDVLSFR